MPIRPLLTIAIATMLGKVISAATQQWLGRANGICRGGLRSSLRYILLCYSLVVSASSFGIALTSNTQFKVFLAQDGMDIGSVEAIYQDHVGFMWIGGGQGLIRYDGHDFEKFTHNPEVENSLANNTVRHIIEDKHNNLWFATDNGLSRFDRDTRTFKNYRTQHHLQSIIWGIAIDHHEKLWLSTVGGLVKFDPLTEKFELVDDERANAASTSDYATSDVLVDGSGTLWVAGNGRGLFRVNTSTHKTIKYVHDENDKNSLSDNKIWSIIQTQDGVIWLGTNKGVDRFNEATSSFTRYSHDKSDPTTLSSDEVTSLVEDQDGNIWAGTGNGISVLDRETDKFVRIQHNPANARSLAANVVRSLFIDNKMDTWVGTFPQGLSFFNRNDMAFETFRHVKDDPTTINRPSVLSILEDSKNRLWIGTDGGGLNRFDSPDSNPVYMTPDVQNPDRTDRVRGGAILDMAEDQDGHVWIGTWAEGVSRYNPKTGLFKHYLSIEGDPTSIRNNNVWSIYVDHNNDVWLATIGGSLYKHNRKEDNFTAYLYDQNDPDSISSVFVWAIHEDKNGHIWVGTSSGLDRLDQSTGKFTHYKFSNADPTTISDGTVKDIHEDSNGIFWIGIQGGGLNRFDPATGKAKRYDKDDGLQNMDVIAVEEDDLGNLWLGTRGGLSQFNPTTEKFRNYDTNNGLQGNHFNIGSSVKLRDGRLIFGGTNGYTRVNPSNIFENTEAPVVVFRDFKILNQSVPVGVPDSPLQRSVNNTDKVTLNHKQSMITFQFSALNFRNPEKNQYAYRLVGFDENWNYIGTLRSATYTNLDAGQYRLQVKAADYEGLWSDEPKTIAIKVLPPPWKTWWAYTIYVLIFFGIIFWIIENQRRKRKFAENQAKILEEKVVERTAELKEKNTNIQAMLSNMRQGLFTIQEDGTIHDEYSRFLEKIFETDQIAGRDFADLLFTNANLGSNELDQSVESVKFTIGDDDCSFDFNSHLFIDEYDVEIAGNNKHLSLDWSPITNDDSIVTKLMVSVRDVTQLRQMEREASAQRRELDIISQLIKVPEKRFLSFEKSARQFIADNRQKIATTTEPDEATLALLFRNMHTIKGNSRTYEFTYLSNTAHDVESTYSAMKSSDSDVTWNSEKLLADLDSLESALFEYANVFRSVLGRGEEQGKVVSKEAGDNKQTLSEILKDIIDSLPSIAFQLNKANPVVNVKSPPGIRFGEELADVLGNVFSHIIRNSVDHGLELPEERIALGKYVSGNIDIDVKNKDQRIVITIKDDGRGLNIERLFKIGVDQGKWTEDNRPSNEQIAEIIFASGVSTKDEVSAISGRGVGMDAVKQFLQDKGGELKINLGEGRSDSPDYLPFEIEINLVNAG